MGESSQKHQRFVDGLLTTHHAKIPIDIGDWTTPHLLTEKDILDIKSETRVDGSGNPEANFEFKNRRLSAAFMTWQRSGSLSLAMEGLSAMTLHRRNFYRKMLRPILYLILIVVVSITAIGVFWFCLKPHIDVIRADLTVTSSVELPQNYDGFATLACSVLLGIALIALVWQLFKPSEWLFWIVGRESGLQLQQKALYWKVVQAITNVDSDIKEAQRTARQLLGIPEANSAKKENASMHESEKVSASQLVMGTLNFEENWECRTLEQIDARRALGHVAAWQSLYRWRNSFSTTAVFVVGGLCGLMVTLLTFWPVVRLLSELGSGGE